MLYEWYGWSCVLQIFTIFQAFQLMNWKSFYQDKEPDGDTEGSSEDFYDAEILDEMTTNRGELKLRTVSNFHDRNQSFSEDRHSQVNDLCRLL